MTYIKEKIAYLKGFSDALKLDDSNEGQALLKIYEILDDITDALDGLAKAQSETEDYLEAVDEELDDLSEYVFMLDADDEDLDLDDFDFDEDDDDLYEVTCPNCGKTYYTDFESFDENDVICPFCETSFVLDEEVVKQLTDDQEEESCPCCHHEEA